MMMMLVLVMLVVLVMMLVLMLVMLVVIVMMVAALAVLIVIVMMLVLVMLVVVVMMRAFALCSRSSATTASSFSWLMPCVRLSRIVPAYSIWLRKNSPKFLTYMRHLPASATVTKLPISASGMSFSTPSTARITSESLPTPLGSIRMRSG